MPTRLSLTEQYDNRDVVAQIYRLISLVESSTIVDVITSKADDNVIVTLEMYDGTSKDFMFKANGVQDITASQSGSVETVTITTDDGTKWRFSFDIAIAGMTTDTAQTVTAIKTFTVSPAFPNGLNVAGGVTTPEADIDRLTVGEIDLTGLLRAMGSVTLDGEVQITNGHSLAVAGDINVAGDMQVVGNTELMGDTEIGGMAFEKSGNRTVMSNPNGITVVGQVTEEVPTTSTGLRNLNPANGTRVQNDLDAYAPMLRTTGNQTRLGVLDFGSNGALRGHACAIWADNTTIASAQGKYIQLLKIKSDSVAGVRSHILLGITPRVRNRGWDFLSLYYGASPDDPSTRVLLGGTLFLRGNTDNKTYVLTQAEDGYSYLYVLGDMNPGDNLQVVSVTCSYPVGTPEYDNTTLIETDVPIGTEIGRYEP